MTVHRLSSPEDCEGIKNLMRRVLALDEHAVAIQPAFLRWKYWDPHPLTSAGRSYVVEGQNGIVAHGCRWPMQILTTSACYDAFHLIDWAGDSSHAGAGLQVLRDTCEKSAALFSIGGSPTTRKILPALGEHFRRRDEAGRAPSYRVVGHMYFLNRPLKPIAAATHEGPLDWKTPARALRNLARAASPALRLSEGYSFKQVTPLEIPESLWLNLTPEVAVTARDSRLLEHFAHCPVLRQPMAFVLSHGNTAVAYFFLVLAGRQVRVADYGPANLNADVSQNLSVAAQIVAKRCYPDALRISAATSEQTVRSGWLHSGLRQSYEEEIRALVVEPMLNNMPQFRLTYLDCDALCF